ncbi:hypothetical protein Sjap_026560 [Stephania japonica]|uniref:Uncharacterized protein n=1 Tax=Stephania japonica TaxID=461633 RepID=A0AAP0E3Z4_9MAGN
MTNWGTTSLAYVYGSGYNLHVVETPSKPLDATVSQRHVTVHREERRAVEGEKREEEEEASCGSESGGEKVTCEGEMSCEREGDEEINRLVLDRVDVELTVVWKDNRNKWESYMNLQEKLYEIELLQELLQEMLLLEYECVDLDVV